jgi:hypothetical protein
MSMRASSEEPTLLMGPAPEMRQSREIVDLWRFMLVTSTRIIRLHCWVARRRADFIIAPVAPWASATEMTAQLSVSLVSPATTCSCRPHVPDAARIQVPSIAICP